MVYFSLEEGFLATKWVRHINRIKVCLDLQKIYCLLSSDSLKWINSKDKFLILNPINFRFIMSEKKRDIKHIL